MHCPSCGQQQVSLDTKFCSRCGFPLGVISEVLAHGGFLPQLAELYKDRKVFTRRNGMAFSLIWCVFFLLIMTPLWSIINIDELASASAIIGIFGGLLILVSAAMFLPKPAKYFGDTRAGIPGAANLPLTGHQQMPSLPAQQSIPANMYGAPRTGMWRETSDLDQVSVTENTTQLLNNDQ